MNRTWIRSLGIGMLAVIPLLVIWTGAAAQFPSPATAVIRGEDIWLRADPAAQTDVLVYLQRGEEITITGEATTADGLVFYPVEVVRTGDVGWVRDLFINPSSIVPLDVVPAETVAEQPEPSDAKEKPAKERPAKEKPAKEKAKRAKTQTPDTAAAEVMSQGLGLTDAQLTEQYGAPAEDPKGSAYALADGQLVAYRSDGRPVGAVERIFAPPVSLAAAQAERARLMPTDASAVSTYVTETGLTLEVFTSAWLMEQFPNEGAWVNDTPGAFIVTYGTYNPGAGVNEVERIVMSTRNNP